MQTVFYRFSGDWVFNRMVTFALLTILSVCLTSESYALSSDEDDGIVSGENKQSRLGVLNPPTVTTTSATNITDTTATSGGKITNPGGSAPTACGVCWSTDHNPTTANSKTSDLQADFREKDDPGYTSNITGLSPGTTYYVRAYATNNDGTGYGSEITVSTKSVPTLTTKSITDITETAARSGGEVTSYGGAVLTAYGVCWSTNHNPTTADSKTNDFGGLFVPSVNYSSNITGLTSGTTYYVRAYATSSIGTGYGSERSFTATGIPSLSTKAVSDIGTTTARSGGEIISSGGQNLSAQGVCWSTSNNPTIADSKTVDMPDKIKHNNGYVSNLTGLSPGTTYYVRAYATNSVGTGYGSEVNFTTIADSDGDGTPDNKDGCPYNAAYTVAGPCGCVPCPPDADGDGVPDSSDGCPSDGGKSQPGLCGCGVPDTDSDGDGTPDCADLCPANPGMVSPGPDGCVVGDIDSDGDGTPDSMDGCPGNPNKTKPGEAGCGEEELDSDGDGVPDSVDTCPDDPNKTMPGQFGCGVSETDTDGDGTPDKLDSCPEDPNKTSPGVDGCGAFEVDTDGDGVPDSVDGCPSDPHKSAPGNLGCGESEKPEIKLSVRVGDGDGDDDDGDTPDGAGSSATASVGEEITALVNVRNVGTGNATNVRVELPVPPNTEFLFAQLVLRGNEPAQALSERLDAVVNGDTVYINVGNVPADYELSFKMTLRATESGDVVIDPKAGSNELGETVNADQPGKAQVNEVAADDDDDSDQNTEVIGTGSAPCGAIGLIPLMGVFCGLFYFRQKQ